MLTSKKRVIFTVTLVFLFMFALVSSAAASTTVNWTIKYNGQEVPGRYVWNAGETQPVYKFQIPWQDGTAGKKIVFYYRFNLQPTTPVPDPQPAPEPEPQPVPDPQQPPVVPEPEPEPQLPEPEPAPEPAPQPGETRLTADEQQLFQLVNQERLQAGLNELKIHTGLVELARLKSKDMIALNYFAHQSPTYGSPFEMMQKAGIAYSYAGENLAGAPTVARAHTALMNSPGHRANILNPNFTHVGIGIVDGGPYGKMFTQMFIKAR
jgi:uncharacterized YkwD family protein